ncbi:Rrf2 family transcriptional regulator [Lactobacillus corticis]|uniref:Rrf2 family transcriptional regulator n=1 Tax=Lactobacillus corticis TaxID=2201249 RepID=A0A916QJ76_9LACO|nr:Rrf2 family transcriptional regulator [Lactobacillus corticis]GFZ27518.1 Rrf2 family transcriptional regulator [Lactobacillus corticis]
MKYSHKLSDAIHIMVYLDMFQDGDLSSRAIASSVNSNASVVRSLMSSLRAAKLIQSKQGIAGAKLTKPAAQINLYEIYRAVEGEQQLLHVDPKTNPNCVIGGNIQTVLEAEYQRIANQAFAEMKRISLQDIIDGIKRQVEH